MIVYTNKSRLFLSLVFSMSKVTVKRKRGDLLPRAQAEAEQMASTHNMTTNEAIKEVKKHIKKLKTDRTRAESYAEKARYILIAMSHKEAEDVQHEPKKKGKGQKDNRPFLFVSAECGQLFDELDYAEAPAELNKDTDLDIVFAIQAETSFALGIKTNREMTEEEKKQDQWWCPGSETEWYEQVCTSVKSGFRSHTVRFINGIPICALERGSGVMLLFDQPENSSCTIFGIRWPGHVCDQIPACFVGINQKMIQISDGSMTVLHAASAEAESNLDTFDEDETSCIDEEKY